MSTPTPTSAGKMLRARRLELGLTQYDLSRAAGMREHDISRYESGRVRSLPLLGAWKLCRALGLDLVELAKALEEES